MTANTDSTGSNDASLQAAAFPFRRTNAGVEVCLIRKKGSEAWGIPKGLVDPGDTLEGTAVNETWEEAGLGGRLVGTVIGHYTYAKWGTTFSVAVYLLEVLEEHASWQEDHSRERRWWPLEEGVALLSRHPVQPLIGRVLRSLASWQLDATGGP